jgi:hypothetical protein
MSVSREVTRVAVCTVGVEARADLHVAAPAAGAAGAALAVGVRVDLQVAALAAGADAAAPSQARIVVAHWGCSMVQHQAETSRSWETYLMVG